MFEILSGADLLEAVASDFAARAATVCAGDLDAAAGALMVAAGVLLAGSNPDDTANQQKLLRWVGDAREIRERWSTKSMVPPCAPDGATRH